MNQDADDMISLQKAYVGKEGLQINRYWGWS